MSLNLRPIVSALARNRTGAVLVAIQIAIALAVVVNAIYIVKQRIDKIARPTGLDVANILVVSSSGFAEGYDYIAALHEDLAYLRGVSGVIAATAVNSIPLSQGGSATTIYSQPTARASSAGENGNYLEIDEQGVEALGLHLIAGRAFSREAILPPAPGGSSAFVPEVILTQRMAKALFPNENPLGRSVYDSLGRGAKITGIVERMHEPWPDSPQIENVMLLPRLPFSFTGAIYYIVRTQPGQRDAVARAIESHLSGSNPGRLIDWIRPLERFKNNIYAADRNMAWFLVLVTVLIMGVTCLGIFGLATFNVSTRTKQIGTRRAVGARRGDIMRYFMVENSIITSTGIATGSALALAVGYWLSLQYKLPRLDLYYLVAAIPVLWLIGQLAVWHPARRASTVPPSVATRTV